MYKITKHLKPFIFNGNTTFKLIRDDNDICEYKVQRDKQSLYNIYYLQDKHPHAINIGTVNVMDEKYTIKDNIPFVVLSLAKRLMRELITTYFTAPITIDVYYDGCCLQCNTFISDETFRSMGFCQQCHKRRKYGKAAETTNIKKLYRVYRNPKAFIFGGSSRFYLFDDDDKQYAFRVEKVKEKRTSFVICYLPDIDFDADAIYVGKVNKALDNAYIRSSKPVKLSHENSEKVLNMARSFFEAITINYNNDKELFIFYHGNCSSCGKFIEDSVTRMSGICKRCSK